MSEEHINIKRYYQNTAPWGAHESTHFQQQILREYLDEIKILLQTESICVLDLGSGIGLNINTLSQYSTNVVAVDISNRALSQSRRSNRDLYANSNINFIACDAQRLPFIDKSFDVVICTEVLEHVVDLEKVLGEIRHILNVDGYLIVSTPNYFNLLGLYKKYKDKKAGKEYWDPWGSHTNGFERHITSHLLEKVLKARNFRLLKTNGAGYIYAWFYLPLLRHYHDRFPFFNLGRLPLIKKIGMQYYILAQKEYNNEK